MPRTFTRIFTSLHHNTIWMQYLKLLKDISSVWSGNMIQRINTFYHHILCLAKQCQFSNIDEHLIDAIISGCKSKKAQDKLLQMSIRMTLEECLFICRHYESLQWHINTVRPTGGEIKAMDGLTRWWPISKNNGRRPAPTVHPDKPKKDCTACGALHQAVECPALPSVCYKCNKQG